MFDFNQIVLFLVYSVIVMFTVLLLFSKDEQSSKKSGNTKEYNRNDDTSN